MVSLSQLSYRQLVGTGDVQWPTFLAPLKITKITWPLLRGQISSDPLTPINMTYLIFKSNLDSMCCVPHCNVSVYIQIWHCSEISNLNCLYYVLEIWKWPERIVSGYEQCTGIMGDFYSNFCILMYFTNFLQTIYRIHIHKLPLNIWKT